MKKENRKPTTTDVGIPVSSDEYSLTVGPDGPILLPEARTASYMKPRPAVMSIIEMQDHFTKVSAVYRKVRTTDPEPIHHIAQELAGYSSVRAADIGCGAGRYDLLLFDALPGLYLTCIDTNQAMLGKAAQLLSDNGIDHFETKQTRVETLELGEQSFDCVVSFNAVHHFDLDDFFRVAREGLKEDGHLFVYTRLPAQNARTIWGRYFPGFVEKEARLIELEMVYRSVERTESLFFNSATCFRYQRSAQLDQLMDQAHNRHYSTFSLYEDGEFDEAMVIFEQRLRDRFADLDQITWFDENILFHVRRTCEAPGTIHLTQRN